MALPTLNDDQCLYLQTIFDYFHEHGKWPTYRYVDRKLTQIRRDLDIEKIAKSLPGTLWGKDLYIHLSDLYQNKARYCVMFFSQYYVAKAWTKHELKAAQARALNENKEYILPIRLDSTEIPGILQTTAYLNWHEETPESVAEAILEKLGKVSHVPLIKERTIMDWLVDEAQMSNGKVSVDLGDIPGVKHSMRMTKNNENWEAWYGMWFEQEFTERMGFEPTEECIRYALERYAEIAE